MTPNKRNIAAARKRLAWAKMRLEIPTEQSLYWARRELLEAIEHIDKAVARKLREAPE